MDNSLKEILWYQFGGSIDMLENAIAMCPEELWDSDSKFWYNAYHCIFFLDYYLTLEPDKFTPPSPFSLSEFDNSGAMPERTYTKEELITYIHFCRNKCHVLFAGMTEEIANKRWKNEWRDYSMIEISIYNMRHVQHHAAQLNLLLRQGINNAPDWVSRTKIKL
ncbi:hypothetical protein BH10BAC5_BH10BAC5_15290 [soil metagenome]